MLVKMSTNGLKHDQVAPVTDVVDGAVGVPKSHWYVAVVNHNSEKLSAERLENAGEKFAMLICPDHPTPCAIKTHVSEPVPYLLYTNTKNISNGAVRYTEAQAAATGEYVPDGYKLIEKLFAIKY